MLSHSKGVVINNFTTYIGRVFCLFITVRKYGLKECRKDRCTYLGKEKGGAGLKCGAGLAKKINDK